MLVRVPRPRCPFCHDDVAPGAAQVPCVACRAWHHAECFGEAHACAACGARERRVLVLRPAAPAPERALGWSLALWWGLLMAIFVVEASILPAFARMFGEVGVSLPPLTELLLDRPARLAFAFALLSLAHAAALTRTPATRVRLWQVTCGLVVLGAGVGVYALFLPLVETIQRL